MTSEKKNKLNEAILRMHRDPNPLTVQSTRMQFYSAVAAIQLASRHPGFNGPTALVAIHWAREISAALAANDPDLRLLLATGWQQDCDAALAPPTSYLLSSDGKGITCCRCGKTSFHEADVANRYCGFCHLFHENANRVEVVIERREDAPP
jgi:hypothetical protein